MPLNSLKHLALIMDGNGRWASLKGKPRAFGHMKGMNKAEEIISYVAKTDISYLTLFALSAENSFRPKTEMSHLTKLFHKALAQKEDFLTQQNIRLHALGDLNLFSKDIRDDLNNLIKKTENHTGLNLILALNYGGQQEIAEGIKKLIPEVKAGTIDSRTFNKDIFNSFLPSSQFPNPDLILRTGGYKRLSNFYLWSSGYSEISFKNVLWPDFHTDMLQEEINKFFTIRRNFGSI